jgi:hypothetical protein
MKRQSSCRLLQKKKRQTISPHSTARRQEKYQLKQKNNLTSTKIKINMNNPRRLFSRQTSINKVTTRQLEQTSNVQTAQ